MLGRLCRDDAGATSGKNKITSRIFLVSLLASEFGTFSRFIQAFLKYVYPVPRVRFGSLPTRVVHIANVCETTPILPQFDENDMASDEDLDASEGSEFASGEEPMGTDDDGDSDMDGGRHTGPQHAITKEMVKDWERRVFEVLHVHCAAKHARERPALAREFTMCISILFISEMSSRWIYCMP
jgi:hypothetical protein